MIHQSDHIVNAWVGAIVVVPAMIMRNSGYLQSDPAIIESVKITREKENSNKLCLEYLWKLQKNKDSLFIKTLSKSEFMLKVDPENLCRVYTAC